MVDDLISDVEFRRMVTGRVAATISYEASILYEPKIDYKVNKKNAIDPTIRYRYGMYAEDKITMKCLLCPDEYMKLYRFIIHSDELEIHFRIGGKVMSFPIAHEQIPQMTDNGRLYNEIYTFTFKSVYHPTPPEEDGDDGGAQGYGTSYGAFYGYS